jgi:hypothetical protein
LAARRRNPPRAHARDLSEHGGHPTISALEAWELRSHLVLTEAMDSLTETEAADLLSEGVHPFLGKQEAAGLSRRDAMAAGAGLDRGALSLLISMTMSSTRFPREVVPLARVAGRPQVQATRLQSMK